MEPECEGRDDNGGGEEGGGLYALANQYEFANWREIDRKGEWN